MTERILEARRALEAGQIRSAVDLIGRWSEEERKSVAGLLLLGEVAEARDRKKVARAAYLRALRTAPRSAEALLGLSWIAYVTGRARSSDDYAWRALALAPEEPLRCRILSFRASLHATIRRFGSAMACLEEAEALEITEGPWAAVARSFVLGQQDRRHEAIEVALAAREKFPDSTAPLQLLADLRSVTGDLPGAREMMDRVVEREPEVVDRLVHLAELCDVVEDWTAARDALQTALEVSPEADGALSTKLRLGRVLERLGDRADPGARPVVLDLGNIVQSHNYCGPASLAAVLRYWGHETDQVEIGAAMSGPDGTTPYRYPEYARELGMKVRVFRGDADTLRLLTGAGLPVVVEVQTAVYGHYLVCVGHDAGRGTLLFRDPARYGLTEMHPDTLAPMWGAQGHRAILIVPAAQKDRLEEHVLQGESLLERYFAAEKLLTEDEPEEARGILEPIAKEESLGPAVFHLLAATHATLGDWDAVVADLNRGVRRFPGDVPLRIREIQALLETDQWDRAFEACEDLLEIDPRNAQALYHRGRCRIVQGELEAARRDFRRSLRIDPTYSRTYAHLGEAHELLGHAEDALLLYEISLDIESGYAWAHAQLGQLKAAAFECPEEAIPHFERAIELFPLYSWAYAHLARVYHEDLDRAEEAEPLYRTAIELAPDYAWAHGQLAALLHEKPGRHDDAEEHYRKSLSIFPQWHWAWMQLGLLLGAHKDNPEDARECFERAAEILPDDVWAWAELADLACKEPEDLEAARAHLERVAGIAPDDPWAHERLVGVLFRLEDLEATAATLEKLISLDPDHHDARFLLADAYDRLGRTAEALERWQAYLEAIEGVEGIPDEDVAHARKRLGKSPKRKRRSGWFSWLSR